MSSCLMPAEIAKLKEAIKKGNLDYQKLSSAKMGTAERQALLAKIVGEQNAKFLNLSIEKKMLLKDPETAIRKVLRESIGLTRAERIKAEAQIKARQLEMQRKRDRLFNPKTGQPILKAILEEKALAKFKDRKNIKAEDIVEMHRLLDAEFVDSIVGDVYERKFGTGMTVDEIQTITTLSQENMKTKARVMPEMPAGNKERMEYGLAYTLMKKFVSELKVEKERIPLRDYAKPENWGKALYNSAGMAKSILASMDMSFFGTQGLKVLYNDPILWGTELVKVHGRAGKQLVAKGPWWKSGDDAVMDSVKAYAYSHPDAMNGKFEAMGIDIGIKGEEAFPTSIPEHIPLVGRVFKASEVAFNSPAIMMRVALAEKYIKIGEAAGKDMTNKVEAQGMGQLVNAMTGRSKLPGSLEQAAEVVNATLFSGRFLASNIHFLSAHMFDGRADIVVRKHAAMNLAKVVAGVYATGYLINKLYPNSVDMDPRGAYFMQPVINGHKFDITAKMGGIVKLCAQIFPTKHNGEWGKWKKSAAGNWTNMNDTGYMKTTALNVVESFFENKLAPVPGVARDYLKGETMQGEKQTLKNVAEQLTVPLPVGTVMDLKANKDNFLEMAQWLILENYGGGVQVLSKYKK